MADVNINIKILDGELADFKAGFLKAKPKPDDYAGTDLQYFKDCIEEWIFNVYKTGKMMIARETTEAEIDDTIVEVT